MKWAQFQNSTKHGYMRCVLLIAADRNHSLLAMEVLVRSIDCEPRYLRRNMSLGMETDHGPWGDSKYSSADMFLLSHAQYFLGIHISSYSMQIASMIPSR